ncbi:MAG: ABC transporter ATP-binding protein, partial [Dermabacter sp.]|nr:ABC transporter ATP-binding protein [Dermabacter sp.]
MTSSAIDMNELTIRFGGLTAVDRLSATVPKGSFSVVIGPNGCGKSTLLRAVAQVRPADEGSVTMLGHDVARMGRRQLARTCSLLPQTTVAPRGLRVGELVARGRHPYHSFLSSSAPGDSEAINRAVERAGVADLVDRYVHELSGGQRQRVWLAMVLAQETPVILLDEPTNGLDPDIALTVRTLIRSLAEDGAAILLTSHLLGEIEDLAHTITVLGAGSVAVSGSLEDVAAHAGRPLSLIRYYLLELNLLAV